jgi:hypothetical protein
MGVKANRPTPIAAASAAAAQATTGHGESAVADLRASVFMAPSTLGSPEYLVKCLLNWLYACQA